MTFSILVPFRAPDDWRQVLADHVRGHLAGIPVTFGDSGHEPFSRAATRNRLVDEAKTDVVILHDADMVAPTDAYEQMADLAADTGQMVVGFTEYRALDRTATRKALVGADPFAQKPAGTTHGWSVGGIVAITRDSWYAAGGMDERFVGWGCEDFAFVSAVELAVGPLLRTPNPAVHLWHPSGQQHPHINANSALQKRYAACETVADLRAVQEGSRPEPTRTEST